MPQEYYQISEREMRDFLESKGFKEINIPNCNELVYEFRHPKDKSLGIRVYTSISEGSARDCGKDAIRCVYWSFDFDGPIQKTKRVHRIKTWKKNLLYRLRMMIVVIRHLPRCPNCSTVTSFKKGKFGHFYGCRKYPECKGTIDGALYDKKLNQLKQKAGELIKRKSDEV